MFQTLSPSDHPSIQMVHLYLQHAIAYGKRKQDSSFSWMLREEEKWRLLQEGAKSSCFDFRDYPPYPLCSPPLPPPRPHTTPSSLLAGKQDEQMFCSSVY